ncbi:MAG: hypothetical protein ACXWJ0_13605 [Xanthobacteraceae bacterium]
MTDRKPLDIPGSLPHAMRVGLLIGFTLCAGFAVAQENNAPAAPEPTEQAAPVAPSAAPQRRPGFLESFGRWVDESVTGMGKGFENAFRGAATKTDEAAKASSQATSDIVKGAVDATKGTADALGKFGGSHVATGRERCTLAANGAPDCRIAAETLCKSKGFSGGSSIDYQTVENCPAQVLLSGQKTAGACKTEHIVTKAMCQ